MSATLRKENIAKRHEKIIAQIREQDEKENAARKKEEVARRQAELANLLPSPTTSEASERAQAGLEFVESVHALRTPPRSPTATNSSPHLPPGADGELSRLRAEVVQLREDLDRAKAQIKSLTDDREQALEQQRQAALREAQDEVVRLKQTVKNLDDVLIQATAEKRRLQDELRTSEDAIDELEDQVRTLRREQQRMRDETDAKTTSAIQDDTRPAKTVRRPSGSTSIGRNEFRVTMKDGKKSITRPKNGRVPLGIE